MLINQLREITGIQDPETLYKALNVRSKIATGSAKGLEAWQYNLCTVIKQSCPPDTWEYCMNSYVHCLRASKRHFVAHTNIQSQHLCKSTKIARSVLASLFNSLSSNAVKMKYDPPLLQ